MTAFDAKKSARKNAKNDIFGDFFGFGDNPEGCMAKDGPAVDVKKEKDKYSRCHDDLNNNEHDKAACCVHIQHSKCQYGHVYFVSAALPYGRSVHGKVLDWPKVGPGSAQS